MNYRSKIWFDDRFFGGDLPRGVAAAAAYGYGDGKENALAPSAAAKNWRGFWGPTYGGGGYLGKVLFYLLE